MDEGYKNIEKELTEECAGVEKEEKDKVSFTYSRKYTLKIFELLTKYATKVKKICGEQFFNERIEYLRNEDTEGYQKCFITWETKEIELM